MIEDRPHDGMIEVGDIEDEPTNDPELAPQVVIEFRDRGIPWMLVPPLLALVAVIAGVGAYNYTNRVQERRPPDPPVLAARVGPLEDDPLPDPLPGYPLTKDLFDGAPATVSLPKVFENPAAIPLDATPKSIAAAPALAASTLGSNGEMPATAPVADPAMPVDSPLPRAAALGFDPHAFDTIDGTSNPATSLPPVDRNLEPVGQSVAPDQPTEKINGPDQPAMIDPDLLPPDPRKAKQDRQKRAIDARRKADQDRVAFHAAVSALYKKHGRRSVPMIAKFCQAYGQGVPPAAKDQAMQLLGKNGFYAGISTAGRINLLRRLDFPETAILGDIFDLAGDHEIPGGRNTPSRDELYLQSVLVLLSNPPGRPGSNQRMAPPPRTSARVQPAPNLTDFDPNP